LTWKQANQYGERLSAFPAEQAAGRKYRLPTEVEWEYACRAGTASEFAFGYQLDPTQANFSEHGGQSNAQPTWPVGYFPPNQWGLYDMHDNVWEWCSDWFDDEYSSASDTDAPSGPVSGCYHVLRSGVSSNADHECVA